MPDFLQLVSLMREQMNATLSRSDVLKPLAWLVGLVGTATTIALFAKPPEWVLHWLLIALIFSIGLYGAAFIFCLIFDRDALRSEKYSLHKMAIEHGLLGDSTAGMFDANTIAGEGRTGVISGDRFAKDRETRMKRRFVAAVSGLDKDDQAKFVEFLRQNGMGWWHWIDDFWLLTERRNVISATQIRDALRDLKSSRRCIVFEVPEDKTWAGFGPTKLPQDMFEWIKNTWKGD